MLKKLLIAVSVLLSSAVFAASVLSWGSATHMYIGAQLKDYRGDYHDLQNMYGAMAPDINSFAPDEIRVGLRHATHHDYQSVVDKARGLPQRAFATGWVTHNEDWGADYYAHLDPGYLRDGKNGVLANLLLLQFPGLPEEARISAAEAVLEAAIDLLLEEHDEDLGRKIKKAAVRRSPTIPLLLAKAYPDFAGKGLLAAEATFRSYAIAYGDIIALPSPSDTQAMATAIADMAKEYYGVDITPEQALLLLGVAMNLCIADDYFAAIEDNIAQMSSHAAPARWETEPSPATLWGEIKTAEF